MLKFPLPLWKNFGQNFTLTEFIKYFVSAADIQNSSNPPSGHPQVVMLTYPCLKDGGVGGLMVGWVWFSA